MSKIWPVCAAADDARLDWLPEDPDNVSVPTFHDVVDSLTDDYHLHPFKCSEWTSMVVRAAAVVAWEQTLSGVPEWDDATALDLNGVAATQAGALAFYVMAAEGPGLGSIGDDALAVWMTHVGRERIENVLTGWQGNPLIAGCWQQLAAGAGLHQGLELFQRYLARGGGLPELEDPHAMSFQPDPLLLKDNDRFPDERIASHWHWLVMKVHPDHTYSTVVLSCGVSSRYVETKQRLQPYLDRLDGWAAESWRQGSDIVKHAGATYAAHPCSGRCWGNVFDPGSFDQILRVWEPMIGRRPVICWSDNGPISPNPYLDGSEEFDRYLGWSAFKEC